MAEKKTKTEVSAEPKAKKDKDDEQRVRVMVPFIEGEDPEVTVIINGRITKFKKGVTVEIPRNVASVLENSNQQMMSAIDNQQKFKKQVTDL